MIKGFIAAFFTLLFGSLLLVGLGVNQPATLCEVSRALEPPAPLPPLGIYSEKQMAVAQTIVDAIPQHEVETMAVAVATSLVATRLAVSKEINGYTVDVNIFDGLADQRDVAAQIASFRDRVQQGTILTDRPATEVVAWALGRPGADVVYEYGQASLIVGKLANTDAAYLLSLKVKDPNCSYSSTAIGDILTIGGVTYPVTGHTQISSRFGWRTHPVYHTRRLHSGVDFPAPCGTPIVPVMPGTVVLVNERTPGFGTLVEILHDNGTTTWYGHMYPGTTYVREGDKVSEGQHIADVGSAGTSTGCHLHVELHLQSGAVVDAGHVFGWY